MATNTRYSLKNKKTFCKKIVGYQINYSWIVSNKSFNKKKSHLHTILKISSLLTKQTSIYK